MAVWSAARRGTHFVPSSLQGRVAQRSMAALTALTLVLFSLAPAIAATIETDLWIYQMGDTVTVTGEGFGPDETVDLVTTDPYGVPVDTGLVGTGPLGEFTYQFVLMSDVGGIYDVVATGRDSGITAATQFDPAQATVTPLSRNYGNVTVGSSVPHTFTLTNTGTTGMNNIVITISGAGAGHFILDLAGTAATLDVDASTTFSVAFAPSSVGTKSASVLVQSNAHPDPSIPLTGTGIAADTTSPSVAMASTASNPTGASPILVTVTFSEPVSGFAANDVAAGNATVGGFAGSGASYSFTLTPTGQGLVTADIPAGVATDTALNPNTAAPQFSRTYDSLAPSAPAITSPADDTVTNNNDVTVSGTAEAGSSVELFDGATSLGTTTATGGSWSFTLTDVADGPHAYTATATDAAANTSATSNTVDVLVDTAAPGAPAITSPADDTVTNNNDVTVSGTAEAGSSVELFDGATSLGTTTATGGSWSFTLTDVADGPHAYTATATDAAANTSATSNTVDVLVDTAAPGAPAITSPADDTVTNNNDVTVSGTAEAGSSVELFDGATSLGTTTATGGSWGFTLTDVADGPHAYTATATDAAANTSATSNTVDVLVDTVAPTLTAPIQSPAANAAGWNNTDVTVTWTCNDALSGPATPTASGSTSGEGSALSATASCSDLAGNSASATQSGIKVDKTAPTNVAGSAARVPDSSGWYRASVLITFAGDDALSGIASCTQQLYNGPDSATALVNGSCTDEAGNTQGASFGLMFDKTAPGISLLSRDPAANGDGWNNAAVTVMWGCDDDTSGVVSPNVADALSTEGAGQTANGTCADVAGNTASASQGGINIDLTSPTLTAPIQSPAANAAGWNNTDVTVTWTCNDALSGPATPTASGSTSGEGSALSATASCSDLAGNSASATQSGIKVDKTAPTNVAGSAARVPDSSGWYRASVLITFAGDDALSGIASCTQQLYNGPDSATALVNGSCTDEAGNTQGASFGLMFDKTAPGISLLSRDPAANGDGWNNAAVTVMWGCDDDTSGVVSPNVADALSTEGAGQTANGTCADVAGNTASASQGGINIDLTSPTLTAPIQSPAANAAGWNNTDVTVTWTCNDALSGPATPTASGSTSGEGSALSATASCSDLAGNTASATQSGIKVDKTAPATPTFVGGPDADASYVFGSVPAAPTCTSTDALSGFASCTVAGYGTSVGSHSMTATALDVAGNDATASRDYTVLAWTLTGFFQPVDMNGIYNTVKNGSTVPLKFRVFAGATELTDVSAVSSLKYVQVSCTGTAPTDEIETTATGGTVLRYGDGQFIYNWKTPSTPGKCLRVTMTTLDGSSLIAYFKLK